MKPELAEAVCIYMYANKYLAVELWSFFQFYSLCLNNFNFSLIRKRIILQYIWEEPELLRAYYYLI